MSSDSVSVSRSASTAGREPVSVERFAVRGRRYCLLLQTAHGARRSPAGGRVRSAAVLNAEIQEREARGSRGLVFPACVQGARWVAWGASDPSRVLWALYVPNDWLARHGAPGLPANDTLVPVAWGVGTRLHQAVPDAAAHRAVREALHAPPPWLSRGMASADPDFPLRLRAESRASGTGAPSPVVAPPVAVRPPRAPVAAPPPASPEAVLAILRAWRAQHAPQSA